MLNKHKLRGVKYQYLALITCHTFKWGLLTKSLDLLGYHSLGDLTYRYESGKRRYYLSSCALLTIQVRTHYVVIACSEFDDYSSSDLFTFPCIYSNVFTRAITHLAISWLNWVNCQ
jgi:hypothetical protein